MNTDEDSQYLRLARDGKDGLAAQFVEQNQDLRRVVDKRLGEKLRRRLDVSDILQDVYIEASGMLSTFLRHPSVPARKWLRLLTAQRLNQLLRCHFLAKRRSLSREVHPDSSDLEGQNALAEISADMSSTESRYARAESEQTVQRALVTLTADDNRILELRAFEGVSNIVAAETLGITEHAATKRHIRALARLNKALREAGWRSN